MAMTTEVSLVLDIINLIFYVGVRSRTHSYGRRSDPSVR